MTKNLSNCDHRKIGKDLSLFHVSDEAVDSIFWHKKGWYVYRTIQEYIRKKHRSIVFEVPLLFELNLEKCFDEILLIKTIPSKQKRNALKRGQDFSLMDQLIKRQTLHSQKIHKSSKVIIN